MKHNLWSEVCGLLQQEVAQEDFNIWLSSLSPLGGELIANGEVLSDFYLSAENLYKMRWVKDKYAVNIEDAVERVCLEKGWRPPAIYYDYDARGRGPQFEEKVRGEEILRLKDDRQAMGVRLDAALTFGNFVEGASNRMAKCISLGLGQCKDMGQTNLFVLCGLSGLGKTHLMHAIVNEMRQTKRVKTLFVNAESFVMNLQFHIVEKRMDVFKQLYRSVDVLLIDDIHFFVGKNKTQEEFFHIIKALNELKKIMVFSCIQPPQYLQGFMEGLQTHLAQGLVMTIEKPDVWMRKLIMQQKAAAMNFQLSETCAEYIAQRISRSVRDLEGALKIVHFYAQVQQRAVDVSLVREALKNITLPVSAPVGLEEIQKAVTRHFGISLVQLVGAGRSRGGVVPRQMAMFLCRRLTKSSLAEIGASFGGRNHTTVLHSCKAFEGLIEKDSHIKYAYTSIQRSLLRE